MSNLNRFLQICAGAFAASVIATTLMVGVTLAAEAKPAHARDHLCFSYEDGFLPCPARTPVAPPSGANHSAARL